MWPDVKAITGISDHQREQLGKALAAPVAILAGSPGTGKTHVMGALIRAIAAQYGESCVAIAAPTGKAAVRCSAAMARHGVRVEATTIHRLLEIGRNGHGDGNWGFQRNESNPLACRFLAVDESSMLDTTLACSLFAACAKGTHVFLLGDPGQLAPVGHGCPLRDFIASEKIPVGTLSEIQRNAGAIVRACADIKAGRHFATVEKYDPATGANLKLIECATPQQQVETLCNVLQAFAASGKFDPVADCQVLVAVNEKSAVSRVALNAVLQGLLNPPAEDEPTAPGGWRTGDKIICLRNCWIESMILRERCNTPRSNVGAWENEYDQGPVQLFLANGDQGVVLAIGEGALIAEFTGPTPRVVRVPVSKKDATASGQAGESGSGGKGGSVGDFSLAYAITVWKAQGSEYPVAIVMADDGGGPNCGVEYWYTAISRASKLCIIIGRRATVDKQVRRITLRLRKTFLAEILKGEPEGQAVATVQASPAATPPLQPVVNDDFIRQLLADL